MSAARTPNDRHVHLALVQGGKAQAEPGDSDADWDDFCRRIGWQGPAREPDDDLAKRIAEGLFSKPFEDDNVIDLDLVRAAVAPQSPGARRHLRRPEAHELDEELESEIRQSFIREAFASPVSHRRLAMSGDAVEGAALGQDAVEGEELERDVRGLEARETGDESSREGLSNVPVREESAALAIIAPDTAQPARRWSRVALRLALAAGVALAVTRLASMASSPSASIPVPSAERAHATTTDQRVDDGSRVDMPQPPEVAPTRAVPLEQPTARPSPRPTTPRTAPKGPKGGTSGPGTLVARRGPDAPTRSRASTVERPASAGSPEIDLAKSEPQASEAIAMGGMGGGIAAWSTAGAPAEASAPWSNTSLYPIAGTLGNTPAPASSLSTFEPSDNRWRAADPPLRDHASWSLSETRDRWVGASLTPAAFDAQASFGVMMQLDLGKALDRL